MKQNGDTGLQPAAADMDFQPEFDFNGEEPLRAAKLLAIPFEYPGEQTVVNYTTEESTSVCPWTGLSDFAHMEISYITHNQ